MQIMPIALPVTKGTLPKTNPANTIAETNSFKDVFDKTINNLNDKQLNANENVQKFLTGEIQDIHTVMIAMEEAKLSMQLAVEVRNKLVEAYQELSRMQV
ncbi:MAG: flagellar hook-basal body protein FliE [Peptococcaceae bacterium BRH_c8a]|nr:MAG: flagellar hook-basal body protein FliE [Peptococcaceae bacterium BRH_c8a]